MALGKYSRVDGRKSSYCSTVTVIVFVGVCLVGVWILMSSAVVPVQNSDLASQKTEMELKNNVTETYANQFEDGPGDMPEDATKGDNSLTDNVDKRKEDLDDSQGFPEKELEKTIEVEGTQEKYMESIEANSETEEEMKRGSENGGAGNKEVDSNSYGQSNLGDEDSSSGVSKIREEANEVKASGQSELEESQNEDHLNLDDNVKKPTEQNTEERKRDYKVEGETHEKIEENQDEDSVESLPETKMEDEAKDPSSNDMFSAGAQSEILNEISTQNGPWSTQAAESENEKELQKSVPLKDIKKYKWKLCNVTAGLDYIPCLDNVQSIRELPSTAHYEHRERHCPDEAPTCLVPLPEGYKKPVRWPKSREQVSLFMLIILENYC